jgi:hypothetical protein
MTTVVDAASHPNGERASHRVASSPAASTATHNHGTETSDPASPGSVA